MPLKQPYLPHMTSPEVAEVLKTCKTVVIPLGAIEQHARHLPLITDYLGVLRVAEEAARRVRLVIAPSVMAGVSPHHMGFPGTISLSAETFAQVVFETAQSLAHHGFKRIVLLNGHGGNDLALINAAARITKETSAKAIYFPNKAQFYEMFLNDVIEKFDSHAGIEETSRALVTFPELVKLDEAETPVLQMSERQKEIVRNLRNASPADRLRFQLMMDSIRDFSKFTSTGSLTFADVKAEASVEYGRANFEKFVNGLCELVTNWELADSD